MIRRTAPILCLVAMLLSGCARHTVVERDAGRIDGAKSISVLSDSQWTIRHEPSNDAEDGETR
jgi:hypothetical protein